MSYEPSGLKRCRPSAASIQLNSLRRQVRSLRKQLEALEIAFQRFAGHKEECACVFHGNHPEYAPKKPCDCGYQTILDTFKTSR